MYRVNSERITLDLDAFVEVEPIRSWMVQQQALALAGRFVAAQQPDKEYAALIECFTFFMHEAQPVWDFVDQHGNIPTTAAGMARLPLDMQLAILGQWQDSLHAKAEEPLPDIPNLRLVDAPNAVDAVFPPGPDNREIKRRLRIAKRTAA